GCVASPRTERTFDASPSLSAVQSCPAAWPPAPDVLRCALLRCGRSRQQPPDAHARPDRSADCPHSRRVFPGGSEAAAAAGLARSAGGGAPLCRGSTGGTGGGGGGGGRGGGGGCTPGPPPAGGGRGGGR